MKVLKLEQKFSIGCYKRVLWCPDNGKTFFSVTHFMKTGPRFFSVIQKRSQEALKNSGRLVGGEAKVTP